MNPDLTTAEFMELIKAAGFNYHDIYGVFPDTIYIDVFRIESMQHKKLAFMKMKPTGANLFQPEAAMEVHICHFSPIVGRGFNDCYFAMPELPEDGYRSGAALARMASPERNCKK